MLNENHLYCLTWNQSGGDDDIDLFALLFEKSHLGIVELLAHLFGISTLIQVNTRMIKEKREDYIRGQFHPPSHSLPKIQPREIGLVLWRQGVYRIHAQ